MDLLETLRRYQHYDEERREFVDYRSLRDYARRLQLSHAHLSRVLNGQSRPGAKIVRAFARRYPEAARDIPLDALAR